MVWSSCAPTCISDTAACTGLWGLFRQASTRDMGEKVSAAIPAQVSDLERSWRQRVGVLILCTAERYLYLCTSYTSLIWVWSSHSCRHGLAVYRDM